MILIIKHISIEGPGIIEDYLRECKREYGIVELDKGEILPSTLDGVDAIISLGGPMGAYEDDKYKFLRQECEFLKSAQENKIPILGICLGAQLLAKALGAEVKKAPQVEIGWYRVNLTQRGRTDPLFRGIGEELLVFQWHEDQFDIPEGGNLLAYSIPCFNQAFRFGENAYGLQFHIEVTPGMIELWFEKYSEDEELKLIDKDEIISFAEENYRAFLTQAEKILSNFLKIVDFISR